MQKEILVGELWNVEKTNMIEEIKKFAKDQNLKLFQLAVMAEGIAEKVVFYPCNACNENYSITKFFIATAIGILADRKLLSLDEKLTDILCDQITKPYDPIWDRVTVRHALQHKMGIDKGVLDIDRDDINTYGTKDLLEFVLRCAPEYEPGTYYCYTDVPHYLLSRVISAVTGNPADDLIREEILIPMHFRQAAFSRCNMNYTIGGSGSYMRTEDVVKLGWLYVNGGRYLGQQIISEKWIETAEEEGFMDQNEFAETTFKGKCGMNGQIVMYSREKKVAIAWHGYDPEEKDRMLIPFIEQL